MLSALVKDQQMSYEKDLWQKDFNRSENVGRSVKWKQLYVRYGIKLSDWYIYICMYYVHDLLTLWRDTQNYNCPWMPHADWTRNSRCVSRLLLREFWRLYLFDLRLYSTSRWQCHIDLAQEEEEEGIEQLFLNRSTTLNSLENFYVSYLLYNSYVSSPAPTCGCVYLFYR